MWWGTSFVNQILSPLIFYEKNNIFLLLLNKNSVLIKIFVALRLWRMEEWLQYNNYAKMKLYMNFSLNIPSWMVCGLTNLYYKSDWVVIWDFRENKYDESLFSGRHYFLIWTLLSSGWSRLGCSILTEDRAGVWPGAETDTTAPGLELRQLCLFQCHSVILSQCYSVTVSKCYIVIVSQCHFCNLKLLL